MMKRFPYEQRARDARDAQAEVHSAARAAKGNPNENAPAALRWKSEAARFWQVLKAAYPQKLANAMDSLRQDEKCDLGPVLEFLEADPIFFGSGYIKEEALTLLKRVALSEDDTRRLRAVLLKAVQENDRREFRRYTRLARHIDSNDLRTALDQLRNDDDAGTRRRADWVFSALEQEELMRSG